MTIEHCVGKTHTLFHSQLTYMILVSHSTMMVQWHLTHFQPGVLLSSGLKAQHQQERKKPGEPVLLSFNLEAAADILRTACRWGRVTWPRPGGKGGTIVCCIRNLKWNVMTLLLSYWGNTKATKNSQPEFIGWWGFQGRNSKEIPLILYATHPRFIETARPHPGLCHNKQNILSAI